MHEALVNLLFDLAVLCLTSCTPNQATELRLPPKRIVQIGYSIAPLNEPGWRVMQRTPTQLSLVKPGMGADDTVAIQAAAFDVSKAPPPEALAVQATAAAPRFKVLKSAVRADDRPECERHHFVTEDQTPARRSRGSGPMTLETSVLKCAHPQAPAVGIVVVYSQRYDGPRDPAFDEKAEELFKGLQFTAAATDAR